MNYDKLMSYNPFELNSMTNHKQQRITFYEHPIYGDEEQIICVCHDLKLADYSGFYDTDDMMSETSDEYYPWFDTDGNLNIGDC